MLRKINAFLGLAMIILFLIHAIAGGYQLAGILPGGNQVLTVLAWILVVIVAAHIVIGIILTVDSLRKHKKTGTVYAKENAEFIIRRVSGFAILVFMVCHIVIFYGNYTNGYRLNLFEGPQLILSICLVISLAVHLFTNIRSMFISFGISQKRRRFDVRVILIVILVFCAVMFVVYFYRWNIGWQWHINLGG